MIKSIGAKIYAFWSDRKNSKWIKNPLEAQEKVLKNLIKHGETTRFGKDHSFEEIIDSRSFRKLIPIRDYEDFRPYIDLILDGGKDFFGQEDLFIMLSQAERHLGLNLFQ